MAPHCQLSLLLAAEPDPCCCPTSHPPYSRTIASCITLTCTEKECYAMIPAGNLDLHSRLALAVLTSARLLHLLSRSDGRMFWCNHWRCLEHCFMLYRQRQQSGSTADSDTSTFDQSLRASISSRSTVDRQISPSQLWQGGWGGEFRWPNMILQLTDARSNWSQV